MNKKSVMKDYKDSCVSVEERIQQLIAIAELDGYLTDDLVREYFQLRFPLIKTPYHRYSGRRAKS